MTQHELFETAVKKAKAGNQQEAYRLLLQFTNQNPHHELAWLWLSEVATSPEEKLRALEQAIAINPQRPQARQRLKQLQEKYGRSPTTFSANGSRQPDSPSGQLEAIRQQLTGHDVEAGRQQLADFLHQHTDHEAAWWLMVQYADSQGNQLIALEHVLRLNARHPEAAAVLAKISPRPEDDLKMGRLYERLEDWETAVLHYKRALKTAKKHEKPLIQHRLQAANTKLKLAKIKTASPGATVLRLAIGPALLYFLLILVQAGLRPRQLSAVLLLANLVFLAGLLLINGLAYAPEHPWLVRLQETAVFKSSLLLRRFGLSLMILPILLLVAQSFTRLWNFVLDLVG